MKAEAKITVSNDGTHQAQVKVLGWHLYRNFKSEHEAREETRELAKTLGLEIVWVRGK